MAKGFTVKADVPKKKAKSVDEFNMDEQYSDNQSDEKNPEQIVKKNIDNVNLDYKIFTTQ